MVGDEYGKTDLKGLEYGELREFFAGLGEPEFRADQVMNWIYKKNATSFQGMTSLPRSLRRRLEDTAEMTVLSTERKRISDDGTRKVLFGLVDGEAIESVLMRYEDRRISACISTQVGCAMECSFCATARGGLIRSLTTAEIIDQVLALERIFDLEITNVVFMGMGEPLANYGATVKAIRLLNAPEGMNIGIRRITVSTCGLVPGIRRLAGEGFDLTLAVSLNAPDDHLRSRLMPINNTYPLEELLSACRYYVDRTGRRISFEYVLIDGLNDRKRDADLLTELLSDITCHVNLIPFNPITCDHYAPSARVQVFRRVLKEAGITVTIRSERGRDIEAACGQLRGS